MSNVKVSVICSSDKMWGLSAWSRALPLLSESTKFDVVSFIECDSKLGGIDKGMESIWFLKTFGVVNTICLSVFYMFNFIMRIISFKPLEYRSLCNELGVPYKRVGNPNSCECIEFVQQYSPDILVIMVDHIVRKELLSIPTLGAVNKHASLLPSNKGLLPYFWARLHNEEQGVSFHIVEEEVDSGALLFQQKVPEWAQGSLVAFYRYVFGEYPKQLLIALNNLVNSDYQKPMADIVSSCYSLPSRDEYKLFSRTNGKVCQPVDLFKIL